MKILAISDHESTYLWDYFEQSKLEGIDLIISCGDLHPHYLTFLVTMTNVPVLYVHGNHDTKYKDTPPEGQLVNVVISISMITFSVLEGRLTEM